MDRDARLTVYLASAPGAGKTRRLLEEARARQRAGLDVAVGWIETKGRPDLEALLEGLPRIPPRKVEVEGTLLEEFDLEAALAAHPSTLVIDELAHTNLAGARNAKRWEDALTLREAGICVIGALNVEHLETVAPVAERAIGFPIREIVPFSFLQTADQVVAIDAPPDLIEARALAGNFKPQTLQVLRELMLRTVDDLTTPALRPTQASTVLAIIDGRGNPAIFLRKCAAFADATDLALEVTTLSNTPGEELERTVRAINARFATPLPIVRGIPNLSNAAATVVAVPNGALARTLASGLVDRQLFIVDPTTLPMSDPELSARHPYAGTAGDRLRIGYGKFTVYLGAASGSGKTYAMLDRAHQMRGQGIDVIGALIETHGDAETIRMLEGLEIIPHKDGKLDRAALLARHPEVALIDDLAHTNAPGSDYPKRYQEVLSIVRSGISVITTLNVEHLEGLSDAVLRLTGSRVKDTLPDGILELADDVVLVDATPELLRARRPEARITIENLRALRDLAIRETMHARTSNRLPAPFSNIVLGVAARERDVELIEWCARVASRLDVELTVAHIAVDRALAPDEVIGKLIAAARAARATWRLEVARNPADGLVALAKKMADAAIAVEGARSPRRFWQRRAFGRRLLDAGATELFVFSPRPFQPG